MARALDALNELMAYCSKAEDEEFWRRSEALPITAIDIAPREMGRRAAKMLADILAGNTAAGAVEVLPLELMIRASTSPTR